MVKSVHESWLDHIKEGIVIRGMGCVSLSCCLARANIATISSVGRINRVRDRGTSQIYLHKHRVHIHIAYTRLDEYALALIQCVHALSTLPLSIYENHMYSLNIFQFEF